MRLLLASCIAVAAFATAAPSFAQPTVEEITVTGRPKTLPETLSYRVSYADLDLTKNGEKELNRRIAVAADYVCGVLNPGVNPTACVADAIASARRQIHPAKIRQMSDPHGFRPGPTWTPPPGKQ